MGTSASFRAPPVPRWQAFTTALQMGLPLERVQSELFNAGPDWEEALAAPAVAAFAVVLVDALEGIPERLLGSGRPELTLQQLAAEAREASDQQGGTSALAFAERAFLGVLTRTAAGGDSLSQTSGDVAAARFAAARDAPGDLVSAFVSELLGQYVRHTVAREAGRLTEGELGLSVSATRKLTRQLALRAEELGRGLPAMPEGGGAIRDGWPSLIRDAFARGRSLPGAGA